MSRSKKRVANKNALHNNLDNKNQEKIEIIEGLENNHDVGEWEKKYLEAQNDLLELGNLLEEAFTNQEKLMESYEALKRERTDSIGYGDELKNIQKSLQDREYQYVMLKNQYELLLQNNMKLEQRYSALSDSKLGKITLLKWKMFNSNNSNHN